MKETKLQWITMTLTSVLAIFVTSLDAGITKKEYVFSDHALYIPEYMRLIKGGDLEGAMK